MRCERAQAACLFALLAAPAVLQCVSAESTAPSLEQVVTAVNTAPRRLLQRQPRSVSITKCSKYEYKSCPDGKSLACCGGSFSGPSKTWVTADTCEVYLMACVIRQTPMCCP